MGTHLPARIFALLLILASACGTARGEQAATRPAEPDATPPAGYLFAHMLDRDYGRLYYALSRDGLRWTALNDGRRIVEAYLGHPDITRGHDGRFYMIGVGREAPEAVLWASSDLIDWKIERELDARMFDAPALDHDPPWRGAPKLFYDAATEQYMVTWHASHKPKLAEATENFWSGMRTYYVTTKDLQKFTEPERLFAFDHMATIDVIVRREGQTYYAIIKDELYPSFDWPTGKTIRIRTSENLTGPWTQPAPPITPNFREAPSAVRRADGRGWYLYYEQYPALAYELSTAPSLAGPWHTVFAPKYSLPEGARHGCVIELRPGEYEAIMARFAPDPPRTDPEEQSSAPSDTTGQ
jgi:hypothetical protein